MTKRSNKWNDFNYKPRDYYGVRYIFELENKILYKDVLQHNDSPMIK